MSYDYHGYHYHKCDEWVNGYHGYHNTRVMNGLMVTMDMVTMNTVTTRVTRASLCIDTCVLYYRAGQRAGADIGCPTQTTEDGTRHSG